MEKRIKDYRQSELVRKPVEPNDSRLEFITPEFYEMFKDFYYGISGLCLGTPGTGKTNFLLWVFILTKKRTVYWNITNKPQINYSGDIMIPVDDMELFKRCLNDTRFHKISIYVDKKYLGQEKFMYEQWNTFNDIVLNYEDIAYSLLREKETKGKILYEKKANLQIINDEFLAVTEEGRHLPSAYKSTVYLGGNIGISYLLAFQRHQNVPKLPLVLSPWKFLFRTDDFDIDALKGKVKNIDLVDKLPPYHFFLFKANTGFFQSYRPVPLLVEERYRKLEI